MQGTTFTILLLTLAVTDGFIFSSKPKCPIKKYKTGKTINGNDLLVHEKFEDRVKAVESVAKDCKVIVNIKGSYYQLADPAERVLISEADLVIGHGFRFELRDSSNALLCNQLCLSRNPTDIPEVKCFLQGLTSRGLIWSRTNSNVLSDGTYASNPNGYQALKVEIQTNCKDAKYRRQLLRALRKMYEEEEEQQSVEDSNDSEKKK